jgi:hypothetical protein
MAAKNKRPKRAEPADIDPRPDIRQVFALHVEACRRRDELLEEARELQAAGKIRAARKHLTQAEEIQERLTALEDECRLKRRRDAVGN